MNVLISYAATGAAMGCVSVIVRALRLLRLLPMPTREDKADRLPIEIIFAIVAVITWTALWPVCLWWTFKFRNGDART